MYSVCIETGNKAGPKRGIKMKTSTVNEEIKKSLQTLMINAGFMAFAQSNGVEVYLTNRKISRQEVSQVLEKYDIEGFSLRVTHCGVLIQEP